MARPIDQSSQDSPMSDAFGASSDTAILRPALSDEPRGMADILESIRRLMDAAPPESAALAEPSDAFERRASDLGHADTIADALAGDDPAEVDVDALADATLAAAARDVTRSDEAGEWRELERLVGLAEELLGAEGGAPPPSEPPAPDVAEEVSRADEADAERISEAPPPLAPEEGLRAHEEAPEAPPEVGSPADEGPGDAPASEETPEEAPPPFPAAALDGALSVMAERDPEPAEETPALQDPPETEDPTATAETEGPAPESAPGRPSAEVSDAVEPADTEALRDPGEPRDPGDPRNGPSAQDLRAREAIADQLRRARKARQAAGGRAGRQVHERLRALIGDYDPSVRAPAEATRPVAPDRAPPPSGARAAAFEQSLLDADLPADVDIDPDQPSPMHRGLDARVDRALADRLEAVAAMEARLARLEAMLQRRLLGDADDDDAR